MYKILLLFALLPAGALAQNADLTAAQERYDREAVYLQTGFFGYAYVKDTRRYSVGIASQRLKRELEVSPLALSEFESFRRARRTSLLLNVVGLAGVLAAPSLASNNEDLAIASLVGGSVALFASIPFRVRANNRLFKSVWLYNRYVIAAPSAR